MESFAQTKEEKSSGLLSGRKHSTTTLHKIWTLWRDKKQTPLLVLPLSCVKISFRLAEDITPAAQSNDAVGSPHNDNDRSDQQKADVKNNKMPPSTQAAMPQQHGEEMDQADGGDPSPDDHLDHINALPASKDKGDLFHEFQSFPMKKVIQTASLQLGF
jgi:hypothetical protein